MPTSWSRINVTNDPELSAALERVAPYFRGTPAARVVHDLAIRGAEELLRSNGEREAAVERLIALSVERTPGIDWNVLERIDDIAWGE